MAAVNSRPDENLPNPDPSIITTQQIDRAVSTLENKIDARIEGIEKATESFHADLTRVPTLLDRSILGLRELIETRMKCIEEDVEVVHVAVAARKEEIRDQTKNLETLIVEKIVGAMSVTGEKIKSLSDVTTQQFISINDKFAEKDKAVSVGLSAQKESAAAQQESNKAAQTKMEDNFTKLLDQGRELLAEVRRNTEVQINDIKSRLDKGEGKISISDPATSDALRMLNGSVNRLKMSEGHSSGKTEGIGMIGSIVLGAIAGLSFLTAIGSLIFAIVRRA